MIICTGKTTKSINEFFDLDKEYIATFHFGKTTPSFDLETEVDGTYPTDHITKEAGGGPAGIQRRTTTDTAHAFCEVH